MKKEIYLRAFYKLADIPRKYRLINNPEVSFSDVELPYTIYGEFYCRTSKPTEINKVLPHIMLFPGNENHIDEYNECYVKAIVNEGNIINTDPNGGTDVCGEITFIEELKL